MNDDAATPVTAVDPATSPGIPKIGLAALTPNAALIETLESLLIEARSGNLRGLTYVGIATNNDTHWGNIGEAVEQKLRTVGLLQWLATRLIQQWDSKHIPGSQ